MRKRVLPVLIFALLALPALSTLFHLEQRWLLLQMRGITAPHPFPAFSTKKFWDKAYQQEFEAWLNYKLPANVLPAKIFNSVYYHVFDKTYAHAGHIIIGKHKSLYEQGYVASYVKNDFPDAEKIAELADELCILQEALQRHGKKFLLVITPSKANMTPQNIPRSYFVYNQKQWERDVYALSVKKFRESGMYLLDCCELLHSDAKGETFFYPGGIHWNDPARILCINAMFASLNLDARLEENERIVAPQANDVDGDLARLLNLLCPPVFYETLRITPEKRDKPLPVKTALIGGSFASGIMDYLVKGNIFRSLSFYYYFTTTQVYTTEGAPARSVRGGAADVLVQEILGHDVICLEMNQEILYAYGTGHVRRFLDAVLPQLTQGKYHENRVENTAGDA